jgi:apolipoprotein D and lipocalin family protein
MISQSTQKNFDISRYTNKFYEIARLPFKWQNHCYFSQATYTWDADKQVMKIQNDCLDENRNILYSRSGEARIQNPNDKSKLRVIFNDGLPADPEGNYWVFWTDYDNYSIVGDGSPEHLWILSRRPTASLKDVMLLSQKVKSLGFDESKLISNSYLVYK